MIGILLAIMGVDRVTVSTGSVQAAIGAILITYDSCQVLFFILQIAFKVRTLAVKTIDKSLNAARRCQHAEPITLRFLYRKQFVFITKDRNGYAAIAPTTLILKRLNSQCSVKLLARLVTELGGCGKVTWTGLSILDVSIDHRLV